MDSTLKSRIEKTIGKIDQLPTLPIVYDSLRKKLCDPRVSAKEVGAVIERDPALTSKILKIVNSAYYSFPKRVSTVSHSVVILGFNEIKNIALSISIIKMFGSAKNDSGFNHEEFWKHCLAVAICSSIIARKVAQVKLDSPEEVFVAGLLHDIGKVIEDQYMHTEFIETVNVSKSDHLSLFEAEKSVLGFTHQELGTYLTERWKLPDMLISAVSFHHQPVARKSNTEQFTLISTVHIADILVRGIGLGSGGDPYIPSLCNECWEHLGLSLSHVEIVIDETIKVFNDLSPLLLQN